MTNRLLLGVVLSFLLFVTPSVILTETRGSSQTKIDRTEILKNYVPNFEIEMRDWAGEEEIIPLGLDDSLRLGGSSQPLPLTPTMQITLRSEGEATCGFQRMVESPGSPL